jgi:hypothetical protein
MFEEGAGVVGRGLVTGGSGGMHEYAKLLEYAAFGAGGGLIGAMTKSRTLRLPRLLVERLEDGETVKVLDAGLLAAPLLGACLAMYFDTRPENALAWGLAAGYAGPTVLNVIIDPLLRKLGLNPDCDVLKPSPAVTDLKENPDAGTGGNL